MTGMGGREISSYGWEEAQVAASCKEDVEYSVSIKGGNGLISRGDFKFSRKTLLYVLGRSVFWLVGWLGR